MTPQELVTSLVGHLLVDDLKITDGPHKVSEQRSVVYVTDTEGNRLRLQVDCA